MHGRSERMLTLDGLRGIAVVAVLIDHAWPGALPGGFAGVDVFFVLSGFLITRILVHELGRQRTIDFIGFYARRVRRIVPAALLCVVGTWLMYAILLGPAVPDTLRTQAASATLSVSNILFAQAATDYFASSAASSPYLHYWSLAVEEQFYLVWPALLLGVTLASAWIAGFVGARVQRPSAAADIGRWLPIATIAVIGAGSLVAAMRVDRIDGFFLFPYRGWELIVGGLLAWLQLEGVARLPAMLRPYRWVGVLAGVVALGLVFIAAPQFGRWPGPATIMAVGGAALLVAGGDTMPGARAFTIGPLRYFGRISYALYLWHWPLLAAAALIALPAIVVPFPLTAAAVGLAIVIASASTFLVEEPIRSTRGRWLVRRPAIGNALAGMAVVAVVVMTMTTPLALAAGSSTTLASALASARTDRERLIDDECYTRITGSAAPRHCYYGAAAAPDGGPTHAGPGDRPVAVLFGDSHAMYWFPLLDDWARDAGIALVPLVRSGCAPTDGLPIDGGADSRCVRWLATALDRIEGLDPVITFVGTSTAIPVVVAGETVEPRIEPDRWAPSFAGMLAKVRDRSAAVLYLADVPRPGFDVPDCLGVHRSDPATCERSLDEAQPPALVAAERNATTMAGVDLVDASAWLCPDALCTWMVDDRIGWVDEHHITSSAARWLRPHLQAIFDAEVGLGPSATMGAAPP